MEKNITCSVTFDYDVNVNFTEEELKALEYYLENNGGTIKQWVSSEHGGLKANPVYGLIQEKIDFERDYVNWEDIEYVYLSDIED